MANTFDPDYGSALDAAAAIRNKAMSCVELTTHMFRRIDAFEPGLNAYVYQLREEALAAAKKADEAIARNGATGVFHGVPVNVKESFSVEGQPCTWGIPALRNSKAPRHSTTVQRLIEAGAIVLGATNVPMHLLDIQSFNDVYGTSNNPWDVTRTPGGSSGGSAASLAAGTAFFSIGSDIGGSIRSPASFCGIYGHKPTLNVVPLTGHAPGGVDPPPGFATHMAVAGPMTRSAEDLEAALMVLAGPEPPDAKAFRWSLFPPRHRSLRDYRIGFLLEDPAVPVSAETKSVLETAIRACEQSGATLIQGWPDDFRFEDLLDTYYYLLGALDFSTMASERQELVRAQMATRPRTFAKGSLSSFADWQVQNLRRLEYRAFWEKYFENIDVFLLPTTFTAAYPHDPTPTDDRMIPTPEGDAFPFWDLLTYVCPASLTGCPATTAPLGLTKSGLPVGIQIVGPYLEDATSIRFAQLLACELGGFEAPKGYAL